MVDKPKILCVGDQGSRDDQLIAHLNESYEVVEVGNSIEALVELARGSFANVLICSEQFRLSSLLRNQRILEGMPDGLVLLDEANTIFWANDCIAEWSGNANVIGKNFYEVFNSPEIIGPDLCPFGTALATRQSRCTTLRCEDNRFFQVHAVPAREQQTGLPPSTLIVTVRDVTSETLQQQKLAAIHQAGIDLADLTTEEVFNMEVEERIAQLSLVIYLVLLIPLISIMLADVPV